MMKQISKQNLTIAVVLALFSLSGAPAPAASVVTAIVTDPLTGVAIDGYDAVSYFTEAEPLEGRPDFEFYWQDVPWYFATTANRDVFMRAPEVYAPRFGGYGTMSLARGFLSDGNPRIYLIYRQALYLFYSTGNRDAFLLAPAQALHDAEANWPALQAELTHQ